MYVVGGAAAAALLRFLRRRQNDTRKPMSAIPPTGPTTTPAIQDLLDFFFFGVAGTRVGLAALVSPLPPEVVAAVVD